MRSWVGEHLRVFIAGLATLATLVSALGWAVPGLRDWFLGHGGIGWIVVAVLAAVVAAEWAVGDRTRQELADLRKTYSDLQAKRPEPSEPSARDVQFFDEIMTSWAWNSPVMNWLQNGFNAKRWPQERSVAIHNTVEDWRERYFDDDTVQDAFDALRSAIGHLSTWMGTYSFPDKNSLDDWHYVVPDGDERSGGWAEFDQVRDEGIANAGRVLETRRELERVGRQRGL